MSDSEQYGPAWIRATVMVHPCGDIHFIGGDRAPGDGDTEYLASKYLRHASKLEESAPSASTNSKSMPCCDVCGGKLNSQGDCKSRIAHLYGE